MTIVLTNVLFYRSLKLLYNQKNKVYSNFSGFDLIGLDKRNVTLSYTFPMYNLYDDTEKEAILSSLSWFQKVVEIEVRVLLAQQLLMI